MTKYLFRPSRIVNGKREKSRIYWLGYRLPHMPKKKAVSLETTDKQVAEKKAREFLVELEQETAGVIAPRSLRESAGKSLDAHLEDYLADLRAQGRDAMYIYNLEKRLVKLWEECGWKVLRDITADSFQMWRARQDKAAKTVNDYLDAANAFLKWLVRNERSTGNPLAKVTKVQTKGQQRRKRRASTFDELNRLLAVAGPRRVGYLAAFFTGLRRAELEALQWGDVHLDAELPFIAARASTTKNHDRAEIRLHPQLAKALQELRTADSQAADPVFAREHIASMYMMRKDLEAAGLPFADGQGRQADFHSLRGSLNTHLAGKVDPQVRQKIMRHSDIKLTLDNYTDSTLLRVSEAITVLPSFAEYAPPCAPPSDISGHLAAQGGTTAVLEDVEKVPENECLSHEMTPDGTTCHLSQMAASLGFEPRQNDSESFVLPLHHEAKCGRQKLWMEGWM